MIPKTLGLCAPSLIALVPERNRFCSKAAPKDELCLHVGARISVGTQSLKRRIRGKRVYPLFCFFLMGIFICTFSYAEMTPEDKNGLSHRYRALVKLKEYLVTLDQ